MTSRNRMASWLGVAVFPGIIILTITGCGSNNKPAPTPTPTPTPSPTEVTSLADGATAPTGTVTLRSAWAAALQNGKAITFDSSLNGKTIQLSVVGEAHSTLKGETYNGMAYLGYAERDYGKSALYAKGNITIDASSLPNGITISWTGGDTNPARVLGVYGDLTLNNVAVTGGYALAEALPDNTAQPYTIARGGGLAVWGTATLVNCTIAGNKIQGDNGAARDRGALGGGIYANGLSIQNCVISGNAAKGYGAAGGGIYSVGGSDNTSGAVNDVTINGCVISGNRTTGQSSYGGGLFTLGGGPTNQAYVHMTNCTVARNLAEDDPELLATSPIFTLYTRGGGIYMGGGSMTITSSTIAENEVHGVVNPAGSAPNLGGGGIAETIGNAHTVEYLVMRHCLVVGNTLSKSNLTDPPTTPPTVIESDMFTGSLLHFYSEGYNLIGALDFSQILVPAPPPDELWRDLNRKHYPKVGDRDGVAIADVLDPDAIHLPLNIVSVGTDAGDPAVWYYLPRGDALNKIPSGQYQVQALMAGYSPFGSGSMRSDNETWDGYFLGEVLADLQTNYTAQLGDSFAGPTFDPSQMMWYEAPNSWPSDGRNAPWIKFWRNLDTAIAGRLGTAGLNDDYWEAFPATSLDPQITLTRSTETRQVQLVSTDQLGKARNSPGDIGAIERASQ